ncbi:MAG: AI-2E family transporter [Acidimicrobiia bacterium]|nr:AI-2E family transporter [Acidimicrobiia bacterium]
MSQRPTLDRAAAFSWRYLVVVAAAAVTLYAVGAVLVVVIPVILGFFVAAVLSPPVQWFKRRGWSPLAATWAGIGTVVPVIAGVVLLVVPSFVDGLTPLTEDFEKASDSFVTWLEEGPLDLSETEIDGYIDDAITSFRSNLGGLTSGIVGGAAVAVEVLTGAVLVLIISFFYLKDGDRAYQALLRRMPDPERADAALTSAWGTLGGYVRGLAIIGLVNAVFIGIGLLIVGTPLVLPLSLVVFFGAFFPIVGAFLSGLLAVSVTFVNGGWVAALVVFGIVLVVQQIEGNVLHPIVFRRVLALHPLVILLAIAAGSVVFGIVGAFLAVPITAVVIAVHQALSADPDRSLVALARTPVYDGKDPLVADGDDDSD